MVLRIFLRSENEFAAEKEFGIVLEDFCEIGMNLRLGQKLELSEKIFVKLKLDLEHFCPNRREKKNWT